MITTAASRPADPDRPTLLLLHGRGGTENDLLPLVPRLGSGLGALAPRGPELQPPGFAWFRHHAVGVPVVESLDERLAELAAWLRLALTSASVTPPVVAVGFSNGGMMAGALAAAHPDLVSAAALLSAAYPLPDHVLAAGGLAGTPVFIGAGDSDPAHPPAVTEAGLASYAGSGAEITHHLSPGAGHEITAAEVAALAAWLGDLPS